MTIPDAVDYAVDVDISTRKGFSENIKRQKDSAEEIHTQEGREADATRAREREIIKPMMPKLVDVKSSDVSLVR